MSSGLTSTPVCVTTIETWKQEVTGEANRRREGNALQLHHTHCGIKKSFIQTVMLLYLYKALRHTGHID